MSERNEREGFHPFKITKYLAIGIGLCVLVGLGGFLAGKNATRREPAPELSAVVLEGQLAQISELASVTYGYTNMAQFENSNDFYGVTIPFTTKRFILTYDGTIKAGIDLRRAQVETGEKTIRVRLPAAQILSHEIDEDSVEIFDEKTSLFNPFTIEDFTSFQAEQKTAMEEKALARGLLEQAGKKAEDSVRMLLEPVMPKEMSLEILQE